MITVGIRVLIVGFILSLVIGCGVTTAAGAQAAADAPVGGPVDGSVDGRVATAAAGAVTATTTVTATGDAPAMRKIDAMLSSLADNGGFSGAVAIARDGVPLLKKGYGMANMEWKIPNTTTTTTKFRIGYLTPTFVTMAILQLQEQGLLSVEDLVCKYLTRCPAAWEPITIRHLLTQASGLPDFTEMVNFAESKRDPITLVRMVNRMRDLPLKFAPGEDSGYSPTDYILLGFILEKVTDGYFSAYLQKNILRPLGMADTGLDNRLSIVPQRAYGYRNQFQPADYIDPSQLYTALGMYSTADDLLRWDKALYSDELLPRATLAPLLEPPLPVTLESQTHPRFGSYVEPVGGRQAINTGGKIPGFISQMVRFPDDKLTIIILSNRDDLNSLRLAGDMAKEIFENASP